MSNELNIDFTQPLPYQILLKGHLGAQWTDWFDGMAIQLEENGNTRLIGMVADQAALHGLLKRIRDIGMPLLGLQCMASCQSE